MTLPAALHKRAFLNHIAVAEPAQVVAIGHRGMEKMVRIFAKKTRGNSSGDCGKTYGNLWKCMPLPKKTVGFSTRKSVRQAEKITQINPEMENLIRRICSWHFPAATGEGGIRGAPLDFLDLIRSPKKAKHTWVNLQLPPETRLPIPIYWVSMGKFM